MIDLFRLSGFIIIFYIAHLGSHSMVDQDSLRKTIKTALCIADVSEKQNAQRPPWQSLERQRFVLHRVPLMLETQASNKAVSTIVHTI